MKIQLKDVGRGKWTGEIDIPDTDDVYAIAGSAYRVAIKHLLSREVEAEYDSATNQGTIYAGGRNVGAFNVLR